MKLETLQFLKSKINQAVRITSTEGEIFVAKVKVVDEEEEYVIYDVLSTNQPDRYESMGTPGQATYMTPFEFIERAEDLESDHD